MREEYIMTITIFGKPHCPQCEFTKRFLDGEGVTYNYINLSTEEDQTNFKVEYPYINSLPAVFLDEELLHTGFRPDDLMELVGE